MADSLGLPTNCPICSDLKLAFLTQKRILRESNKTLIHEVSALKKQVVDITSKLATADFNMAELISKNIHENEKKIELLSQAVINGQKLINQYWEMLKESGLADNDKPNIIPNGCLSFMKQGVEFPTECVDTQGDSTFVTTCNKSTVNSNSKPVKRKVCENLQFNRAKKQKLTALCHGFESPHLAINHDIRHFLATGEVTVDVEALRQIIPKAVVNFIKEQEGDVNKYLETMYIEQGIENRIFPDEKRLLDLLANLYKNSVKHSLMETIWNEIFRKGNNLFATFQLCRLFTNLSKLWGDAEQAHKLAYNVALCGHPDMAMMILAVIGAWPEVFSISHPEGVTPISSVLQHILTNTLNAEPVKLNQFKNILKGLGFWNDELTTLTAETLLKSLLGNLENIIKQGGNIDELFQASKAMELLLVHQGAAWTKEYFITRLLVSVVMKFNNNKSENRHEVKLALVARVLNIFCSFLRVLKVSKRSVMFLIKQVFNKLVNKKSDNFSLETACVDVLIELNAVYPNICLGLIQKWQKNNKGRIPAHIFSKLQLVNSPSQSAAQ